MNISATAELVGREFLDLHVGDKPLAVVRHDFHRYPEIGYEEHKTAAMVCAALDTLNIPYKCGIAGTGVLASLTGSLTKDPANARVIAFRAELDALPMQEENSFSHQSTIAGRKHGCGHDGHMTILLGLAAHLARNPDFDGIVRFIFQPAEEGMAGARKMIEEGLFEEFPTDQIYALHNWPSLPAGTIGVLPAAIMSGGHILDVKVRGTGGHGAMPHACTDQLNIAVQILNSLQVFVARRFPPESPAVLTVTRIQAGDANAVIPDTVSFDGTIRVLNDEAASILHAELPDLIRGIASAWGAEAEIFLQEHYPITRNNSDAARLVEQAVSNLGLPLANPASGLHPAMTSEDFSFMLQKVPGCYFWLGQGGIGLHHPSYDFNDDMLPIGVQLLSEIAGLALSANPAPYQNQSTGDQT